MRKPRLECPGALYHVIVRGNQRQRIFLKDEDHERYLKLLGERLERRSFTLYAYCLMGNHIHLLIEQGSKYPLSRYIQRLHSAYTSYFNRRHGGAGHVFQGRHKVIVVDKRRHLAELVRHIHLNPHRAKMENPDRYPWTSHRQYLGTERRPLAAVKTETVLAAYPKNKWVGYYLGFMGEGKKADCRGCLEEVRNGMIMGDGKFEKKIYVKAGIRNNPKTPKTRRSIRQIWEELLIRRKLDREPEGWARSRLMAEATYVAVEGVGMKQREVAEYFNVEPTTVNKALKKLERKWREGTGGRRELMRLANGY